MSILVVAAGDDQFWARFTIPSVCKAFRDLYRSRDPSPLHSLLFLDFAKEIAAAKRAATRRSSRREPVVRATRVISWARTHAESVDGLYLNSRDGASLGDFNATNFAQLVAAVGPHLIAILIGKYFDHLLGPPFWAALRALVVRGGRLRRLQVFDIPKAFSTSDVEPLTQLRGSFEVLVLCGLIGDDNVPLFGLRRFPESLLALTNLTALGLNFLFRIEAIPGGISNLKKLRMLSKLRLRPSLAARELGALSQVDLLDVSWNAALGAAPDDVAFPPELNGMTSLRDLRLQACGLRRVPAFVRELSSLEEIWLNQNEHLQIDAPLDDLIKCYPRLRLVKMLKEFEGTWTPTSLAHLEAFKAKLQKKNPSPKVEF